MKSKESQNSGFKVFDFKTGKPILTGNWYYKDISIPKFMFEEALAYVKKIEEDDTGFMKNILEQCNTYNEQLNNVTEADKATEIKELKQKIEILTDSLKGKEEEPNKNKNIGNIELSPVFSTAELFNE